jgi:predicted Zn-dependent protease
MSSQKIPFDERIHTALLDELGLAIPDFSHETVARVMPALNRIREQLPPMVAEVLWMSAPIAFAVPGRYVYISRSLIEYCPSDAAVAFALAHEIGHHDLGHTDHGSRVLAAEGLARAPKALALFAVEAFARLLYSRDHEIWADAYALGLCQRAGFEPRKCLECFDVLTRYSLDHHDLDGVYGSDEELELDAAIADNPISRAYSGLRLWRARHRRSHPSLHERRQILLRQIETMRR